MKLWDTHKCGVESRNRRSVSHCNTSNAVALLWNVKPLLYTSRLNLSFSTGSSDKSTSSAYRVLNLVIPTSLLSLCNSAWGFKNLVSISSFIPLNLHPASLGNRSTACYMHLLISSRTDRSTSWVCSLGIRFFLLTRRSSIGISCFSPILRTSSTDCVTSVSRSSLKKATNAFIFWAQFSNDKLFCCKYFWTSWDSLRTSFQKCKKDRKEIRWVTFEMSWAWPRVSAFWFWSQSSSDALTIPSLSKCSAFTD